MTCSGCGKVITGTNYLNTGNGPHHLACWLERTKS